MPKQTKAEAVALALAPFTFHGYEPAPGYGPDGRHSHSKDAKGSCLFCGSSDAFNVNLSTQQFRCWSCNVQGNLPTFLGQLHAKHLAGTTEAHYKELARERKFGTHWKLLRLHRLAYDSHTDRWLIPVSGPVSSKTGKLDQQQPSLANLRVWSYGTPLLHTAGCPASLYNLSRLSPLGPIFLVEGEWDAIALDYLFFQNGLNGPPQAANSHATLDKDNPPCSIVATPGANVFKEEWCRFFASRPVFICFDHDDAGKSGMIRTQKLLEESSSPPSSINTIHWPADTANKYDLRDLITSQLAKPKTVWNRLRSMLSIATITDTDPNIPAGLVSSQNSGGAGGLNGDAQQPRDLGGYRTDRVVTTFLKGDPAKTTTFKDLIKRYDKEMHLTQHIIEGIAVSLAGIMSIRYPGDPLWTFLIGPPGSGKSLILQSFSKAAEYVNYQSKLTAKALVSGMGGSHFDVSLIQHLAGKCLIVKDYTAIKSMPITSQEELYGILRDAYDGRVNQHYGNGAVRDYVNCHFSMLAGVTDVIHGDSRAALGERFLKCELLGPGHDHTNQILAAIDDSVEDREITSDLKNACSYYLRYATQNLPSPSVPDWVKHRILALAQLTGILRAAIYYDPHQAMSTRPRPEVGTRLAKQLVKLGKALCVVFNKPAIDAEIYALLERIGFDTAHGWNLEILTLILNHKEIASVDLIQRLNIAQATFDKLMANLLAINAVTATYRSGVNGHARNVKVWTAQPHIVEYWQTARLETRKHKPINKTKKQSRILAASKPSARKKK